MKRLRHLVLLGRDLTVFGGRIGALWFLPVLVVIVLTAVTAVSAQLVLPYVVYTFF